MLKVMMKVLGYSAMISVCFVYVIGAYKTTCTWSALAEDYLCFTDEQSAPTWLVLAVIASIVYGLAEFIYGRLTKPTADRLRGSSG